MSVKYSKEVKKKGMIQCMSASWKREKMIPWISGGKTLENSRKAEAAIQ